MRRRVGQLQVKQLLLPARDQRFPKGTAAGGAEMCMRRRVASAARARPVVPVGPTAGGFASYSAVQLWRGQRTASGPGLARSRQRPKTNIFPISDFLTFWHLILAKSGGGLSRP
jgi:hypothetical protein